MTLLNKQMQVQSPIPPNTSKEGGAANGRPGVVLAVVVLVWAAILLSFQSHVALVLEAWATLPSHAHGYVVLLVVAYLLWNKRAQLQQVPCIPSLKGLVFLNILGVAALLGSMTSVAALVQFAIVFMMFGAVWAVAGDRAARVSLGPMSFLLFAVPVGHEVLPLLMNWTADATVAALRESGVPVYQEGRNFVIPSGRWSVVEACGGIRYLMTSIFIGAFFAYLTYTRPLKRLLFMVWAVIMPLVANWIRAYVIVMVAHLTGNEWGLGMSHLALGWVIFGVAIFVTFAIGARWRDPVPVAVSQSAVGGGAPLRRILSVAAVAALVPYAWHVVSGVVESAGEGRTPVLAFASLAALERAPAGEDGVRPVFPGARVVHQATYLFNGEPVDVYVAYYRNQKQGSEMVSVLNKLEPTGDWSWSYSARAGRLPELPGRLLEGYVRNGRHAAMHHLYWVGGMTTTNDMLSKLMLVLSRLRGQGDDSAFVAITAYSKESLELAGARTQAFEARHLQGLLRDLDQVGNQ